MKRIQSTLSRALGRRPQPPSAPRKRFAVLAIAAFVCAIFIAVPTVFVATGTMQKGSSGPIQGGKASGLTPTWSQAERFAETPALRDLKPEPLTPEQAAKLESIREDKEKNEENTRRVKPDQDPKKTQPLIDSAINNFKNPEASNAVTNPLQNFDGPDMDVVAPLFGGGRFAPPDTNAAVGPNHVVITTNSVVQVFSKTGVPAGPAVRISALLAGIANAADDDGDPIVIYDSLADRWIISQFNLTVTANSTHEHIAVSKTSDPTGAYYAYDFLMTANRPADYPHMGVWSDGYYMSTNDFSLPVFSNPFQGAGLYAFERNKMLIGDPTAKIIRFNTNNQHGGMLPSNLQGFTPPPVGTPNLFGEFDADEFGAAFDLVRFFSFHADFATPANSTLTQGPDIATLAFDARQPASRSVMQQPSPGEGLDAIADRLMNALNFRVLAGGVQSLVLNFTVNVSGVNPTNAATYQGGVRWMELRRNAGTGVVTINQQATYAPGSGNPTGRDLWMAAVAQDGEGNIGLGASATNSTATPSILNPTAIYTGRLPGDPANTLPQGEVDALSAVTKGVQTATGNRWGDYSSLFVDPADECTFWGAFEYVDSPTASFDWNTRIFSFKVNPACVTAPRGTINGTITNCGNGQPIPNAVIATPDGFFRQTNASGQFSMIVTPGTYMVTASAPGTGFGNCTQTIMVAANGTATVNCCLAPSAVIVSAGATLVSESCTPANGALDPNETVTSDWRCHKPKRSAKLRRCRRRRSGRLPQLYLYRYRNLWRNCYCKHPVPGRRDQPRHCHLHIHPWRAGHRFNGELRRRDGPGPARRLGNGLHQRRRQLHSHRHVHARLQLGDPGVERRHRAQLGFPQRSELRHQQHARYSVLQRHLGFHPVDVQEQLQHGKHLRRWRPGNLDQRRGFHRHRHRRGQFRYRCLQRHHQRQLPQPDCRASGVDG